MSPTDASCRWTHLTRSWTGVDRATLIETVDQHFKAGGFERLFGSWWWFRLPIAATLSEGANLPLPGIRSHVD